MYCYKCGKKLLPGSQYCSHCGIKVIEENQCLDKDCIGNIEKENRSLSSMEDEPLVMTRTNDSEVSLDSKKHSFLQLLLCIAVMILASLAYGGIGILSLFYVTSAYLYPSVVSGVMIMVIMYFILKNNEVHVQYRRVSCLLVIIGAVIAGITGIIASIVAIVFILYIARNKL